MCVRRFYLYFSITYCVGLFVGVSSVSFLIPPAAYPARCGLLTTTLLVTCAPFSTLTINYLIWKKITLYIWKGVGEPLHLCSLDDSLRLDRPDRTSRLDLRMYESPKNWFILTMGLAQSYLFGTNNDQTKKFKQKLIFCSEAPPPQPYFVHLGQKISFVWNRPKGSRWAQNGPKWSKTLDHLMLASLPCLAIIGPKCTIFKPSPVMNNGPKSKKKRLITRSPICGLLIEPQNTLFET